MCDVVHARRKRFAATVEVGCAVASAMGSRGQGRATRRAAIWHEPAIEATAARRTRSCLLVNTCNVSQDVDPTKMWMGGADCGPMPSGREAAQALQHPPRLARIDLPPPLVREMVERIAAFWRSRFEELLDECRVPAEAEVAA